MRKRALWVGFVASATILNAAERVELHGYAEWRSENMLIVEGQRVRASETTRFNGTGYGRTLDSIPLGYEVEVDGYRTRDGAVIARKIEAKPNGSALFEGQIRSAFDATEERWRRRGYVYEEGASGRVRRLGELRERGADVSRVRRIMNRLVPPYRRASEFRVYVVENDAWNAMAAPNGSVFVFSGLLQDMDDDELAIIIGHELAHTTHEHARRQYKRSIWTSLGLASALAVTGNGSGSGERAALVSTAASIGALAFTNHYSRSHEDQADRVGLRYAHEAGYDVSKAPALWLRFGRKYGGQPEALNFFFGSHSTPRARARNLQKEIGLNYR